MNARILAIIALAVVTAAGCSKSSDEVPSAESLAMNPSLESLANNPLVSNLMSSLGLSAAQAAGGAGALLGLAQENMAEADWSKIASAIPGSSSLISQAKALGGITGKFGSLADLSGAFSKMGLSPDQVSSLTPALTDYVSKAAGPEVGNLLAAAIK